MKDTMLITIAREEALTWRWTAYDERGAIQGQQDRCQDVPTCIEEMLKWLLPFPGEPAEPEAPPQPRKAAPRPKRRRARTRA